MYRRCMEVLEVARSRAQGGASLLELPAPPGYFRRALVPPPTLVDDLGVRTRATSPKFNSALWNGRFAA
jgi:hypothetical protein